MNIDPSVLVQQGGFAAAAAVLATGYWPLWRAYQRALAESARLQDKLVVQAERMSPLLAQTNEVIEKNTEAIDRGRRR